MLHPLPQGDASCREQLCAWGMLRLGVEAWRQGGVKRGGLDEN